MNNADVNFNKITDLINLNNEKEMKAFDLSKNLETEKEAIDFQKNQNLEKTNKGNNNIITFQKISQNLEKIFSTDEKKELDRRFLLYS